MVESDTSSVPLLTQRSSFQEYFAFLRAIWNADGCCQTLFIGGLLGCGVGSLLAVVPHVLTQRFAEQIHGYDDGNTDVLCLDVRGAKSEACVQGGQDAQNAASYAAMASHIMALLCNSTAGSYSDIHGRRRIQIFCLLLMTLSPAALIMIQTNKHINPIWFYILDSISNGIISFMPIAYSILSDIIPTNNRAASFGLYVGFFMIGLTVGSYVATTLNDMHAAEMSLGVRATALLVAIFFLPETLPPNVAQANQHRSYFHEETVLEIVRMPVRELSILAQSKLLILVSVASFFGKMVFRASATLIYYYLENNLAFEEKDVALWLLIGGTLNIVLQVFLLKHLISLMGERVLLISSFLFGAAENIMIGAARSKRLIYISNCVGSLKFIDDPLLSSIASRNVDKTDQGKIQGSLASLGALAEAAGPPAINFVYRHIHLFGMGTMFIAAAGLQVLAAIASVLMPWQQGTVIGEISEPPSQQSLESGTDEASALSEHQSVRECDSFSSSSYTT